ncbi:MAG: 4-(cytidine 5'-diphospho)-2-C-methyl-D-erythritol kinase [Pseudomonadota bacterium]
MRRKPTQALKSMAPWGQVEDAPAKVNLTLRITGRRADGYHKLSSLIVFASLGDRVAVDQAAEWGVSLTGPLAGPLKAEPPEANLAVRAAKALAAALGRPSGEAVHIRLEKHIPMAAGLGGGSADAAAVLRLLAKAWGDVDPAILHPIALGLGADIPVCVFNAPALAEGIGEVLTPLPALPDLPAVLVNPQVPVPTGPVFARLKAAGSPLRDDTALADGVKAGLSFGGLIDAVGRERNDLEAPAIHLQPVIADVLDALRATTGCVLARMSGSGATCFGVFPTAEEASRASQALTSAHPDWWVKPITLYGKAQEKGRVSSAG